MDILTMFSMYVLRFCFYFFLSSAFLLKMFHGFIHNSFQRLLKKIKESDVFFQIFIHGVLYVFENVQTFMRNFALETLPVIRMEISSGVFQEHLLWIFFQKFQQQFLHKSFQQLSQKYLHAFHQEFIQRFVKKTFSTVFFFGKFPKSSFRKPFKNFPKSCSTDSFLIVKLLMDHLRISSRDDLEKKIRSLFRNFLPGFLKKYTRNFFKNFSMDFFSKNHT